MVLLIATVVGVALFCFLKGYIPTGVVCLGGLSRTYGFPALLFASVSLFLKGHVVVAVLPIVLIGWNIVGLFLLKRKQESPNAD